MFFYTASKHADAYTNTHTDSGKLAYFYVCPTGFYENPSYTGESNFASLMSGHTIQVRKPFLFDAMGTKYL